MLHCSVYIVVDDTTLKYVWPPSVVAAILNIGIEYEHFVCCFRPLVLPESPIDLPTRFDGEKYWLFRLAKNMNTGSLSFVCSAVYFSGNDAVGVEERQRDRDRDKQILLLWDPKW